MSLLNKDYALTAQEIEQYKTEGYVGPFDALEKEEAEKFCKVIYQNILPTTTPYSPDKPTRVRHLDSKTIVNLCSNPSILGRISSLLGSDLVLWYSNLFDKPPSTLDKVEKYPWHQDSNYNFLEPTVAVSAWLALTPATEENGCVELIPGSHKSSIPLIKNDDPKYSKWFYGKAADPSYYDETKKIPMILKPGQFFLFDLHTLHRSNENLTKQRRLGLTIRITKTSVKMLHHDWPCILIKGSDQFKKNKYINSPTTDPDTSIKYKTGVYTKILSHKIGSFWSRYIK
jgi:hypothetical protein